MEEVVRGTGSEDERHDVESTDDEYGYRWMILRDPDFEDLVVGVNAVSSAIQGGGYGDRILAAVFAFRDEKDRPLYWIYNYKRGAFYPFVPGRRRAAARQRARAAAEGPDRRGPAGRARARALVPPLGHPDLAEALLDPGHGEARQLGRREQVAFRLTDLAAHADARRQGVARDDLELVGLEPQRLVRIGAA